MKKNKVAVIVKQAGKNKLIFLAEEDVVGGDIYVELFEN